MSVTLTPSFFAAALIAAARFVVSSMPLMPCWVNLIVVMKVAIEQSPFRKDTSDRTSTGIQASLSWHHELVSFGPHGQYRARSGSHDGLGDAAHDDVGQTSPTVCGQYDQVDVM